MKIYLQNHNRVGDGLEKHFELVGIDDAQKIVLWQDVIGEGQGLAKLGHLRGKPVIQIQHGRRGHTQYKPPFNKEMLSDKICVWGTKDIEILTRAGVPKEKIELTGTTVFSHLKPRKKHKGINLVFSPDHWDYDIEENDEVVKVLRKLKGINITTKIIQGHDVKKYDNPRFSNPDSDMHLDVCAEVLSTADIVVCISEGTFELMAQILDIPVVQIDIFKSRPSLGDKRYMKVRYVASEACKRTIDLKQLPKLIYHQLKNPDELKEERRIVAITEGGILIKDSLKNIIKVIKKA